MGEGIISQEDREFTTSLGNWTGQAVWNPGPIGGFYGLAKFEPDPSPDTRTIDLAYPHVRVMRGKLNAFIIATYRPSGITVARARTRLTDGVYTFERPWEDLIVDDTWFTVGHSADIPSDWNIQNTVLSFDFQSIGLVTGSLIYGDLATLYWLAPPQHLPILGVG